MLSWSGQQHTNVLASLRPAYITQLLGVSRQIIRHLGVSRLMYARHYVIQGDLDVEQNTVLANGAQAMTGIMDMDDHFINNLPNLVNEQDAATRNYVDTLNQRKLIISIC